LGKRGISRYRRLSEHKTGRIRKETPPRHIIIKMINIQNKERI
jgi:hypothetical protein